MRKSTAAMSALAALLVVGAAVLWVWPASPAARSGVGPSAGYAAWRPAAPLPVPRVESGVAVTEGDLLVVSGFVDAELEATPRVDRYDPRVDAWTRLADLPESMTHANLAVVGSRVWMVGGFEGAHPGPTTTDVRIYDLEADRWEDGPPLPAPRGAGSLTYAGGLLHYIGGFHPDRETNASEHWVLDPTSPDAWSGAAPLPAARGQSGAVELDGQVYVVGGQFFHDGGPVDLPLVHAYEPATDSWRRVADLPRPVSHIEGSTFVHRGRIHVYGGRSNVTGAAQLADGYLYDPTSDLWIGLAPIPEPVLGPVARPLGGDLIVAGGLSASGPRAAAWRRPLADAWEAGVSLPEPLAEVAAGIIDGTLYVVGGGSPATLAYDLGARRWLSPAPATRPYPGDHHAARVWDGKLYLFGGFGRAAGKTQIYDPERDAWRIGRDMPFAAGSSASAAIGDRIYVAGGIVGERTTAEAAVYDPLRDEWTPIAPMPLPRNHAASGTDGSRLWVFGGRGPGSGDANVVADGFADTQVYDPVTDIWSTSADPGSGLAPLPQARGGMGAAVWVEDRFHVFGGETRSGEGADRHGVYDRVDVYDPRTNRWKRGAPMPVARHGIYPVGAANRIFVAGGGERAGAAASRVLDVYVAP